MGRANAEAIELMRRHCRHGRIEAVSGNSEAGAMLGLPMGPLDVRCKHAPPPRVEEHQALELARVPLRVPISRRSGDERD